MYLLRHGQSYFNLHFTSTRIDPGIEDPELTELGLAQAEDVATRFAKVPLTRIIISPYTRALQTAQPMLKLHQVPVEIMHEVRERAAFACDIGSPPDLLAARFPHHQFGHLQAQWWSDPIETEASITRRADAFRALMSERTDAKGTLLVSHWAFILALTGKSLENGETLEYDAREGKPTHIDWNQ